MRVLRRRIVATLAAMEVGFLVFMAAVVTNGWLLGWNGSVVLLLDAFAGLVSGACMAFVARAMSHRAGDAIYAGVVLALGLAAILLPPISSPGGPEYWVLPPLAAIPIGAAATAILLARRDVAGSPGAARH